MTTENKRFNVFDVDGTIFLEDHKKGSYHIGEIGNVEVNCLNDIADRLNELNDENIELHIQNDFLKDENKHMRTVINENMQLKKLLRKISNSDGEIWLDNGEIIRLKRIFKGEWIND